MAGDIDLYFLPFFRSGGKEMAFFPGLTAVSPARKVARGRESDQLIIYLTFSGNVPLSTSDYDRITSQLSAYFYRSAGSLTTALRDTTERLNHFLVEQNMRTTGRGQYIIGRLILGVLRGRRLVLAQSGPTHAFHLTSEQTRHVCDAPMSGRGLGLSQTTSIYFSQLNLKPGDLLVLSNQLPTGWEQVLLAERSTSPLDILRRKLLAASGDDLNASLIQMRAGSGKMTIQRSVQIQSDPVPAVPEQGNVPVSDLPLKAEKTPTGITEESARGDGSLLKSTRPASTPSLKNELKSAPAIQPQETPAVAPREQPLSRREQILAGQYARPENGVRSSQEYHNSPPSREPQKKPEVGLRSKVVSDTSNAHPTGPTRRQLFFRSLANLMQDVRKIVGKATTSMQRMIPRMLPDSAGNRGSPPGPTMVFVAIAVPLLVVTVSSIVYMRYGSVAQYEEYYQLALQQALSVVGQEDPAVARLTWEQTLYYLDKAETYQTTQQSQELRLEAQTALDGMDSIVRLDFTLAIQGGLSNSIEVVRMVASGNDLFLLDASSGSVKYASLGDRIYSEDRRFLCGPGTYGSNQIGKLIDINILPLTNTLYSQIMGMDASGRMIYCLPGSSGQEAEVYSLTPPDVGFKGIAGFTFDASGQSLYVLDPPANAVWVYENIDGYYSGPPTLFFGVDVPAKMSSSVDLAINGDNLFLLFQDGGLAACMLSLSGDTTSNRCNDITIQDTRPGHQPGLTITDAIFTQMTFANPPDPSLYLLEPLTQAIFRFTSSTSEGIILQGQFRRTGDRSYEWVGRPATAMAISPNRYLFISIGNQVYFASDSP